MKTGCPVLPYFIGAVAALCLVLSLPGAARAQTEQVVLELRVIAQETKAPIPGARIKVLTEQEKEQEKTTGEDGRALLKWSSPLEFPLSVRVFKSGFAPQEMLWRDRDALPERYTMAMPASQTIGGVVRDESGQPIPGVAMSLSFPQRLIGPRVPALPIQTDAEGRWQADFVPANASYIRVDLSHPEFVPESSEDEEGFLRALANGQAESRMQSVLALRGRVLDAQGNPLIGAKVTRGTERVIGLGRAVSVYTDEEGWFQFPKAPAGRALVAAAAEDFAPAIKVAAWSTGSDPIEFRLEPGHVLRGRVIDREGHPIPQVRIRADEWRQMRYPGWETGTDGEGRFVLFNMPPDEVKFDFIKAGYMSRLMFGLTASEAEHEVTLGPTLRVRGRVVDAATGEPIPQFTLAPGWPRQVLGRDGQLETRGANWSRHQEQTFSGGEFELFFDRPVLIGTREPHDFLFRVTAEGYDPAVSQVVRHDEEEAVVDFELTTGGGQRVTVRQPDNSPAEGAEVFVTTQPFGPTIENGHVRLDPRFDRIQADASGQFVLPPGEESAFIVVLHESGLTEATVEPLGEPAELLLQSWARIEGTLKVGGSPAAGEKVALGFAQIWVQEENRLREKRRAHRIYRTETDGDGRFVFERVPPDEVAVARVVNDNRPRHLSMGIWEVWGACSKINLRLQPGQTATVAIEEPGHAVSGRLALPAELGQPHWSEGVYRISPVDWQPAVPEDLDHETRQAWLDEWFWSKKGRPFHRWIVGTPQVGSTGHIRWNFNPWHLSIQPDGSFQIDDLPPGNYRLDLALLDPLRSPTVRQDVASLQYQFSVPAPAPVQSVAGDSGRPLRVETDETNGPDATTDQIKLGALELQPVAVPIEVKEPTDASPFHAGIALNATQLRPGQVFTVYVRARVAEGHFIYAMTDPSEGSVPTQLDLRLPAGVSKVSGWLSPPIRGRPDRKRVHIDEPLFRRHLRVPANAAPGPIRIACEVTYQVCTDELCWPPEKISLETTAEVVTSH